MGRREEHAPREQAKGNLTGTIALGNPQRLIDMDAQGIDYQAININAWGYSADRTLARDVVAIQNQKISEWCAKHPDRFVGMASLALQYPELAAEQLEQAVKKLGLRGAAIGGSVEGQELSDRKFDPFWAKAEELGVLLFMHPQPAPGTTQNMRLQGKGGLGNTIGNPLETSVFLSHLIFEGTLDRFPGLEDLRGARRRLPGVVHWVDPMRCAAAAARWAPTAKRSRRSRASTSGASCSSTR